MIEEIMDTLLNALGKIMWVLLIVFGIWYGCNYGYLAWGFLLVAFITWASIKILVAVVLIGLNDTQRKMDSIYHELIRKREREEEKAAVMGKKLEEEAGDEEYIPVTIKNVEEVKYLHRKGYDIQDIANRLGMRAAKVKWIINTNK